MASSMFLQHNEALAPPYRVLIDTNFINFSLQNKLELVSGMMDCLYAKCTLPTEYQTYVYLFTLFKAYLA
jgi:rRNA-processing protein FCF1